MSLAVQSYPELYTLLIGWHLYDELWNLLNQTGLTFLPFLVMIYRNIITPYQHQHHMVNTSMARMEVDFIVTMFIIFFCCAPLMPLTPNLISYTPTCQNQSVNPGNTNTTYDKAFAVPTQAINVPIFWYAVISISEGLTSAANTTITCVPDLRSMITQVDMTKINNPALKQEVQDFWQQCYVPAKTQYFQDEQSNNSKLAIINQNINTYGPADTEWLGSHAFQNTYYQTLTANQPVPGFAYNPSNDINQNNDNHNPPTYGTPNCSDWWNDSDNGLKTQLYNQLPKTWLQQFGNYVNSSQTQDQVVQQILTNVSNGYSDANNTVGDDGYSHLTEGLGTLLQQAETYPKVYAAEQAAPIIQAILLMLVYTFLPFALVFSGYQVRALVAGAMIIFSLIFWSYIWHLIMWIDTTLINALYPSWFAKQSPQATLADMIIASLIIFAPLFWFSFMAAMGVAVSDVVTQSVNGLGNIGSESASRGVQVTKQVVGQAGSKAIR